MSNPATRQPSEYTRERAAVRDRARAARLRDAREFYHEHLRLAEGLTPEERWRAENVLTTLWREQSRVMKWTHFSDAVKFVRNVMVRV